MVRRSTFGPPAVLYLTVLQVGRPDMNPSRMQIRSEVNGQYRRGGHHRIRV